MKAIVGSVSLEINQPIGDFLDFKSIKFENINSLKRQSLIKEMNVVTKQKYVDVLERLKKT